jgi:hypothetical protein
MDLDEARRAPATDWIASYKGDPFGLNKQNSSEQNARH